MAFRARLGGALGLAGRVGYWALALIALLLVAVGARSGRRRAAFAIAAAIYGALALTTTFDLLAWVRFLPFVLLLGDDDVRLLGRWFAKPSRARTVIFDADCGICLLVCRILVRLDPFQRLRFVGNDEDERIAKSVDREVLETSVVVVDAAGRVFTQERAVLEIARALPFGILLLGWLGIPGLAAVGRRGYRAIADNRIAISSWLGLGACGMPLTATPASAPPPQRRAWSRLRLLLREGSAVLVLVLLSCAVLSDSPWSAATVAPSSGAAAAARSFRLVGLAGRFGPEPPKQAGRLVVDATLPDGRHLDLLTARPPRLADTRGPPLAPLWRAYEDRIRQPAFQHYRALFRDWLLTRHAPKPQAVTVWWVRDELPAPGAGRPKAPPAERIFSVAPKTLLPWLAPGAQP